MTRLFIDEKEELQSIHERLHWLSKNIDLEWASVVTRSDSASDGQTSSVPREKEMQLRPRPKATLDDKAALASARSIHTPLLSLHDAENEAECRSTAIQPHHDNNISTLLCGHSLTPLPCVDAEEEARDGRHQQSSTAGGSQIVTQTVEELSGNATSMRQLLRARKLPVPTTALQKPTMKRKLPQNHAQSYHKQNKTQSHYHEKELALFKEMDHVDQDIIEAKDIYQRLLHQCPSASEDVALFLVRLIYAVASPQAFALLKDTFTVLKSENEIIVPQSTNTAAQTINALNALDTAATAQSLLRRFHLVRLYALRMEKEKQYELEKPQRHAMKSRLRKRMAQRIYESSSSLALTDLMAEAYPHLDRPVRMRDAAGTEYGRRHTALKHMLVAGRNWHALQRRFSSGILALIPTGRECGIQNSEYVASFIRWL